MALHRLTGVGYCYSDAIIIAILLLVRRRRDHGNKPPCSFTARPQGVAYQAKRPTPEITRLEFTRPRETAPDHIKHTQQPQIPRVFATNMPNLPPQPSTIRLSTALYLTPQLSCTCYQEYMKQPRPAHTITICEQRR
jgi:hypothetical protein